MNVLLLWVPLGQFKITIVIIDLCEWWESAKWCSLYGINFLHLALRDGPFISPIKKMVKPSVTCIVGLQIRLTGNGWEALLPPFSISLDKNHVCCACWPEEETKADEWGSNYTARGQEWGRGILAPFSTAAAWLPQ